MPKIIVITGAESTGKSILTRQLSAYFKAPSFPEFPRLYVEQLNRPYNFDDVYSIALMQKAQMKIAKSLKNDFVFFDTWLVISMIWFDEVFGKVPSWIVETISESPVSLFLLCDTDLPWVPDPVRENGGEMREMLQMRYRKVISDLGFAYGEVSGYADERFKNALKIIQQL